MRSISAGLPMPAAVEAIPLVRTVRAACSQTPAAGVTKTHSPTGIAYYRLVGRQPRHSANPLREGRAKPTVPGPREAAPCRTRKETPSPTVLVMVNIGGITTDPCAIAKFYLFIDGAIVGLSSVSYNSNNNRLGFEIGSLSMTLLHNLAAGSHTFQVQEATDFRLRSVQRVWGRWRLHARLHRWDSDTLRIPPTVMRRSVREAGLQRRRPDAEHPKPAIGGHLKTGQRNN